MKLNQKNRLWLKHFKQNFNRPPRILHIGNIANNAYNNAKLLNQAGIDCDVICHEYYHIMGCPEWEDADFTGEIGDEFFPDWTGVNLKGFSRPRWFAQGPLELCAAYLTARRTDNRETAERLWAELARWNKTPLRPPEDHAAGATPEIPPGSRAGRSRFSPPPFRRAAAMFRRFLATCARPDADQCLMEICTRRLGGRGESGIAAKAGYLVLKTAAVPLKIYAGQGRRYASRDNAAAEGATRDEDWRGEFQKRLTDLSGGFAAAFPGRADRLSPADMLPWTGVYKMWKDLFAHYDLVQAYSTDPLLPMLCGFRPFIGYEHGTIRDIPFENSQIGRLCAMAYQCADAVLISNPDCEAAAKKLGCRNYEYMPHIIDAKYRPAASDARDSLQIRRDAFLIFSPARQNWGIKGNDITFRAFAKLLEDEPAALLAVAFWGQDVERSRDLIQELGIGGKVIHLPPLNIHRLIRWLNAADCVVDQYHGYFGGIAPAALACGKALIMGLDFSLYAWAFKEPPPIYNAATPETVRDALLRIRRAPDRDLPARAADWVRKAYHWEAAVNTNIGMFRKVLGN